MPQLYLLENNSENEKIAKIASLLGISHQVVDGIPTDSTAVIISGASYDRHKDALNTQTQNVFIYDAASSEVLSKQFAKLPEAAGTVEITTNHPDITNPLTGLNFQAEAPQPSFTCPSEFESLITVNEQPLFVRNDNLFISAASSVVDLDTKAEAECEPHRQYFSTLIPLVMFIKAVFQEQCWHLSQPSACITVDDPLLRPTYGFIEFDDFKQWLADESLAATFAFIPWNYNRSNKRITKLFRDHANTLSISIHGCDHTNREFGETDSDRLAAMVNTAATRMNKHEAKYDLTHDRVMIFPQGKFSYEALDALGLVDFIAAVNSSLFPTNYQNEYTLKDLLDLSVVSPSGVPLIRRRYPVSVFDFACDRLFEKPLIITQHHDDFSAGFAPLTTFAKQLNQMEPKLTWMPLGKLLTETQRQKINLDGTLVTRTMARDTHKTQSNSALPAHRLLDYSVQERGKIAARRYLSEIRDNVVHKSPLLTNVAKAIRG